MGLTKRILFLWFVGNCIFCGNLYAQTGLPVGAEIQNLERSLAKQGISAAEKHDALLRLAQLRQLSGDLEGASRAWLEAAASEPGKTDEHALLGSAFCLAAMGEWDRANAALRPILQANRSGPVLLRSRFLDACVKGWSAADTSALRVLADNAEYAELKSEIYYTLWKTLAANSGADSAEVWKRRLVAEFPHSPEGRIAAAENAPAQNPAIVTKQSPLWLLLPGRGGFSLNPAPGTTQVSQASAQAGPSQTAAAAPAQQPAPSPAASSGARLQTGLFSRQENAQAQLERLQAAGFTAALVRRMVNSAEYWAVTVPAGDDQNLRIRELKNAGFESFPVN
jgi:tetratricopeptide (TPR) repeat protein